MTPIGRSYIPRQRINMDEDSLRVQRAFLQRYSGESVGSHWGIYLLTVAAAIVSAIIYAFAH